MSHFIFPSYAAAFFGVPNIAFWPYLEIAILLGVALVTIPRNVTGREERNKTEIFGRLFLAIPMGAFGVDHFIFPKVVEAIVPSWLPWHSFWAYLVGVALLAAALSITLKKYAVLAATLLGAMIFSFVLLIHIPNVAPRTGNRILWAVLSRDLCFSAGAFAFAISEAKQFRYKRPIAHVIRLVIGISAVFFGVEHFLHRELAPVVPLDLRMPSWMPCQATIAYLTGVVLVTSGLSMVANWKARAAAAWLGIFVALVVLLVYAPIVIAKPSDIDNGLNYFVDTLAFSGAVLLVSRILSQRSDQFDRIEQSVGLSSPGFSA
jgi:uncharacterized membrane protein